MKIVIQSMNFVWTVTERQVFHISVVSGRLHMVSLFIYLFLSATTSIRKNFTKLFYYTVSRL